MTENNILPVCQNFDFNQLHQQATFRQQQNQLELERLVQEGMQQSYQYNPVLHNLDQLQPQTHVNYSSLFINPSFPKFQYHSQVSVPTIPENSVQTGSFTNYPETTVGQLWPMPVGNLFSHTEYSAQIESHTNYPESSLAIPRPIPIGDGFRLAETSTHEELFTNDDLESSLGIVIRGRPLPRGYRFHPKPKELVRYYLSFSIQNLPRPEYHDILIPQLDVYSDNPWKLVEMRKPQEPILKYWYFLSPRNRKYRNGLRAARHAGNGFWKLSGQEKPIVYNGARIGSERVLDFFVGKHPRGTKSDWKMYEYEANEDKKNKLPIKDPLKLDSFVICRIYQIKERKKKNKDQAQNDRQPENNNEPSDNVAHDVQN